jgi:FPC/CPF motif-containing protein YcgG
VGRTTSGGFPTHGPAGAKKKEDAGREGRIMSGVAVETWTSRVLDHGKLGVTPEDSWKLDAYEQYKTRLRATDYPCFFGQAGEARGEMLYAFIANGNLEKLLIDMREFVRLVGTPQYERCSLVAFFEPDTAVTSHDAFVTHFWKALEHLSEQDSAPGTERTPDDPLWEFSFERCEMFVVGCSPTYRLRRSRNLGPGMVLVFQPRSLFIDPATSEPIAAEVRRRIHKRMLAYDDMPVHPDIGFYGDPINREWKQYALPDDNEPETGNCPFTCMQGEHPDTLLSGAYRFRAALSFRNDD